MNIHAFDHAAIDLKLKSVIFCLALWAGTLSNVLAAEDCKALTGLHAGGVRVVEATAIDPSSFPENRWSPPASLGVPAAVSVPFCRVLGSIHQRMGFELWLPPATTWNSRLLGAGVGGDAGVFNYGDLARGVAAGYASATTDGGHKASETLWMMRRDALLDYTHRAQHEMNQAVRALIAKYYGRPTNYAYFLGCSGGGRQALKQMQEYPNDYNGVVAGAAAPAMPEMSVRHLWQGLYQQRNPDGALTHDDWAVVSAAVLRACDAADGLADKVVENPLSCKFDVTALQCSAGQASSSAAACLSAEKIRTVQAFQAPLKDENGRKLDNGLLPGVSTRPGPPPPLLLPFFAQGAHRDPMWKAENFHMARDLALAHRRMPQMRADDANLTAFEKRGGKAILYQGWLDPSVIAGQSLDYFEKVQQQMGAERRQKLMRLYMVPGMLHCRGGEGVDQFGGGNSTVPIGLADRDMLTALTRWVEQGIAPDSIIGARFENDRLVRERKLCPWPQVAQYTGGNAELAASFQCGLPTAAATSVQRIDGNHAAGDRWAIEKPTPWNGKLLLYGRGYGSGPRDAAPETAPRGVKELLLAEGYALAASNYTGREWALEEAPGDQIEVLDEFERRFGKAQRTIAWGTSMGGLTTLAMIERNPQRFDGALPLCASVSGSLGMLNTALDGAFAFRSLVAPNSDIRVVGIDDDRVNGVRVQQALDLAWRTPQGKARVMLAGALAQLPLWTDSAAAEPAAGDFAAQAEQLRRSFQMGVFLPRVNQETRAQGRYSWNTGVDYRAQLRKSGRWNLVKRFYAEAGLDLEADLGELNAAPRINADPAAVAYMRNNYVPTGNLKIPVLTLQTIGDGLTVPATHGSLRKIVRDAGNSKWLAQIFSRRAGHCTATPAETIAALKTLEHRLDRGRWDLALSSLARRGEHLPGGTQFIRHEEPALLRHCGAKPGSCAGEPPLP